MQERFGTVGPDVLLAVCVAVGAAVRAAAFVRALLQYRLPGADTARVRWQRAKGVVMSVVQSVDVVCMCVALLLLLHYSYGVMPSLRLYGDPQVRCEAAGSAVFCLRVRGAAGLSVTVPSHYRRDHDRRLQPSLIVSTASLVVVCFVVQIYDAASHTASDAFLKLRANVSTADAYAALTAPEESVPDAVPGATVQFPPPRRCPLPLEKIDQLLEGDDPELFKPGALCRYGMLVQACARASALATRRRSVGILIGTRLTLARRVAFCHCLRHPAAWQARRYRVIQMSSVA